MTKVLAQTYRWTEEYSAFLSYILMAGTIMMAILYGMNVYHIVSRTVAVKNLEKQTSSLQMQVQELDAQYIGLTAKITPDVAKKFGLHEGSVTAYIPKTPTQARIAMAGGEL